MFLEAAADFLFDRHHGRTAAVGGRDVYVNGSGIIHTDVSQDAQFVDVDDGDFRIRDGGDDAPDLIDVFHGGSFYKDENPKQ